MLLTHVVQFFYDALLTLAYPQLCTICSHSVEQRKLGLACAACWNVTRIFTGAESMCWKCGMPAQVDVSPPRTDHVRCRRCDALSFTAARAIGPYEGALRESVLLLKRQPHLAPHLENLLVAAALRDPLITSSRIVPVPLHHQRLRARGFNQAVIIAQALSKSLGLPSDEISLLRVSSSDKYRAGLDAKGRQETVAGAFEVRHPRLVESEDILLVDDVFTTGATVSACAETLLAAGAKSVFVLTIARARS